MKTLIKIVETKNGKKYYKFSTKQNRLFPITKLEAESLIASNNYQEFNLY